MQIPEERNLSYEDNLIECGMSALETKRLNGDQIDVVKTSGGYKRHLFFQLN